MFNQRQSDLLMLADGIGTVQDTMPVEALGPSSTRQSGVDVTPPARPVSGLSAFSFSSLLVPRTSHGRAISLTWVVDASSGSLVVGSGSP